MLTNILVFFISGLVFFFIFFLFDKAKIRYQKHLSKINYLIAQSKVNNLVLHDIQRVIYSISELESYSLECVRDVGIKKAVAEITGKEIHRSITQIEKQMWGNFLRSRHHAFREIFLVLIKDLKVDFSFIQHDEYDLLKIQCGDPHDCSFQAWTIVEPKDNIEFPVLNGKNKIPEDCLLGRDDGEFSLHPYPENAFREYKKYIICNDHWVSRERLLFYIASALQNWECPSSVVYSFHNKSRFGWNWLDESVRREPVKNF